MNHTLCGVTYSQFAGCFDDATGQQTRLTFEEGSQKLLFQWWT